MPHPSAGRSCSGRCAWTPDADVAIHPDALDHRPLFDTVAAGVHSSMNTSIAVASDGQVFVGYEHGQDLHLAASFGGGWVDEVLTSGWYWSMELADDDAIHAAYVQHTAFHAMHHTTNASGWWVDTIPDSGRESRVSPARFLAVDGTGAAHVIHVDPDTEELRHVTDGTGNWVGETVEASAGGSPSFAVEPDGTAHLFYTSTGDWVNRHATNAGGAWALETVPIPGNGSTPSAVLVYLTDLTGAWVAHVIDGQSDDWGPDIALDADGEVHISYMDLVAQEARHVTFTPPNGIDDDRDGISW